MGQRNWRLIFTVSALGLMLLFAMTIILLGYLSASSDAVGRYAPVGEPTNIKHK